MFVLAAPDIDRVGPLFAPERPGPLVYEHIANTGQGTVEVDRWPDPRVAMARVGEDFSLRGDPGCLPLDDLAGVAGFVEAAPIWEPSLRQVDASLGVWDR